MSDLEAVARALWSRAVETKRTSLPWEYAKSLYLRDAEAALDALSTPRDAELGSDT